MWVTFSPNCSQTLSSSSLEQGTEKSLRKCAANHYAILFFYPIEPTDEKIIEITEWNYRSVPTVWEQQHFFFYSLRSNSQINIYIIDPITWKIQTAQYYRKIIEKLTLQGIKIYNQTPSVEGKKKSNHR